MKVKVNKKIKLISILLVLVMLISVGYALLSTTLTINGTANVKASSWKIYFTNVQPTEGGVTPTTAPTVPENSKDTTELEWAVSFNTPGQFYEFTVDAVNEGTIDAMISTATADIVTSQLTEAQRKYLDYTVTYSDGAPIEQYDRLAAGATETLRVRVAFKTDVEAEDLPETAQEITAFTYTANYVKADENAKDRETAEPVDENLGKLRAYFVGKGMDDVMNGSTFIDDNETIPDASTSITPVAEYGYDGSDVIFAIGIAYEDKLYWVKYSMESPQVTAVEPINRNNIIERLNIYIALSEQGIYGASFDQENKEYIKDTLGLIDSNIRVLSDNINTYPVLLEYNGHNYELIEEPTYEIPVIVDAE